MRKTCSKCKVPKYPSEFFKCSKSASGLQSQCKECKSKGVSSYYRRNPHKVSKRTHEESRDRYYRNRVSWNVSRRIRKTLSGGGKSRSWEELVDYSLEDLKQHLESKFQEGMTWENYGLWEIDHIVPISYFGYMEEGDQKFLKCWSLKNLQPLWSSDNMVKSNKVV